MGPKVLTIVDAFVSSESIQNTLTSTLNGLNQNGFEILLSSSHPIPSEVQKLVKYCFFDSRNQLYEYEDYTYTQPWRFWIGCGNFTSHNLTTSVQRHGLSVMCNLFNSLKLAKSLGYTHFQKILYDVDLTEDCYSFLQSVPSLVSASGKKGLVYYNDEKIPGTHHWNDIPDMNGAYFYMEIDHFLEKIPNIDSEETYRKVLRESFGNLTFLTFERFLYLFFNRKGDQEILVKRGSEYPKDFNGIAESKEISFLNFPKKYHNLFSRVLRNEKNNEYVLLSDNFSGEAESRKFVIFDESGICVGELFHDVKPKHWQLHYLPSSARTIEVYKSEEMIYSERIPEDCIGRIEMY